MLYKDWLLDWLKNYVMPSLKDKTYNSYRDIVFNHLIPKLGDYSIDELSPLIVQKFVTELSQSGNTYIYVFSVHFQPLVSLSLSGYTLSALSSSRLAETLS